jgi:hypothetical protein
MELPQQISFRRLIGIILTVIGVICAGYVFISLSTQPTFIIYLIYLALFAFGSVIFLSGIYLITTNKPDKRLLKLFEELKQKQNCNSDNEPLIESKRGLIRCNLLPGFYCLPLLNTIFYNENSTKISDNAIKFSFLHEEGHFREIQSNVIIALFSQIVMSGMIITGFLSGICLLIFGSLLLGGNFEKPEILIILFSSLILFLIFSFLAVLFVLIWLMTTRTFQTPLQMDEYVSDEYAAITLRDCFGIDTPSIYLKEVLEDIVKYFEIKYGKKRSFYRKMQYVFKGGTHP